MHLTGESYVSPSMDGASLHRQIFHPTRGESAGTVLLMHGLGDHLGCHLRAAEMFCDRHFLGAGVDWPGHGRSDGKRGHIDGLEQVFAVIDETLDWMDSQSFPSGPRGLYAHSTGAFFALHYLYHREQTRPRDPEAGPLFDWIWLSSPLMRPDNDHSAPVIWASRWLARFYPTFTFDTKVRPERSRHIVPEGPAASEQMDGCHHHVSAALGAGLVNAGRWLDRTAPLIHDPTRLLLTQGEEDGICPAEFSRDYFEKIPARDKTYALLPGLRHEIMREPGNEKVVAMIEAWLDALVPEPAESAARASQ